MLAALDPSVRASNDWRAWRRSITGTAHKKASPFCLLLHHELPPHQREGRARWQR